MSEDSTAQIPPDGWNEIPLKNVATIAFSGVDKKTRSSEPSVHLCNYLDVYENAYIREGHVFMEATATRLEIDGFGLRPGDVVITKDSETPDDIGVPALIESIVGTVVCGYHLALVRPRGDSNSLFVAKQLGHERAIRYFAKSAQGSTRYGLGKAAVEALPIWWPPREEQDGIAKVLQAVDEAISKTEDIIAKLELIKQGMLDDLLTRGIDEGGAPRPSPDADPHLYKESPIGRIPRSWHYLSAGDVFDVQPGLTLGPHRVPRDSPFPYLRVANVFKGRLDLSDVAWLNARPFEVAQMLLRAGDLLLVEGHANIEQIGRVAIADERVAGLTYQNHLFRLRPNTLEPDFCEMWMNGSWVRSYWRRMCSTSSGLNTINQPALKAIPIPLPSQEERARI